MSPGPRRGLFTSAGGDTVVIRCSTVSDGDFHIETSPAALAHRRQAFQPGRWSQLDEIHGVQVRTVTEPGQFDITIGDGAVTTARGVVLACWVGDCAPVAFVGADGVIGVAHAGWKGAWDGVLEATVAAMRGAGESGPITAHLGPCIHPCCYEFGAADLARFTGRFGPQVAGTTTWGTPSLDMPTVVAACLTAAGATPDTRLTGCTRCTPGRWFSHRRGDAGRHVVTVVKMASR